MQPVGSGQYPVAFANYVLEHVKDLEGAIQEIGRVLAPGGVFIAAVPNPSAVEFIASKHSPLWFHKKVRGGMAWETEYAYKNIPGMLELFYRYGFAVEEVRYWPFIEQYLSKYPPSERHGKAV
jgi:SAM-dependent methyltransferase